MAEVTRDSQVKPDIDYHLDCQFLEWEGLREYAEWWPEMEGIDKEVFDLEWHGITESRLADLQKWAEQGLLTPAQRLRYKQLMRFVKKQRPVLEKLLQD